MAYCPNCGTKIGQTANFCKECGCDLRAAEVQESKPKENRSQSKCAKHPQNDSIGNCADCGILLCKICGTALGDVLYCSSCIDKVISHTSENDSDVIKEELTGNDDDMEAAVTLPWEGKLGRRIRFYALGAPLHYAMKKMEGRVYSACFNASRIDGNQAVEHVFWLFNRSGATIRINSIRIYQSDNNLLQVINREDITKQWGSRELGPGKELTGILNYTISLKDKTRGKWYIEWDVLDGGGVPFTIKEHYNIYAQSKT